MAVENTSGRRRPVPVHHDAMRMLADDDLAAVLSIVGIQDERAERLDVGPAATTPRADLLARTVRGIVHVEFVKDRPPDLHARMISCRLRLRSRQRTVPITQVVLSLRDVPIPEGFDDGFLRCTWNVVRVHELDPVVLLRNPTTAAVAALARGSTPQRTAVLVAAAELITAHSDPDRRNLLLGAATALASIVLPRRAITSALQEAAVPVLVRDTPLGRELYQEGRQDGRREGRHEGRRQGRQEGEERAVLHLTVLMLRRRFAGDDARVAAVASRLAALPDEERISLILGAGSLDDLQP